jgi:hypothetical protein
MRKKKKLGTVTIKKLGGVVVVETIVSAKDTLFPEKLKKANAILEKIDLTDFINSPHKY